MTTPIAILDGYETPAAEVQGGVSGRQDDCCPCRKPRGSGPRLTAKGTPDRRGGGSSPAQQAARDRLTKAAGACKAGRWKGKHDSFNSCVRAQVAQAK